MSDVEDGSYTGRANNGSDDVLENPEDDLDNLDDLLDDFEAKAADAKVESRASPNGETSKIAGAESLSSLEARYIARELEAQMASLLQEAKPPEGGESLSERSIRKDNSQAPSAHDSRSSSTNLGGEAFVDAIQKTVQRLGASNNEANLTEAPPETDDILGQLMKGLQEDSDAGQIGSGAGLDDLIESMMQQLTNKDVLYEPMVELHRKFPQWLDDHRASIPSADLEKHEEQQRLVDAIVARFNQSAYSDTNATDRDFIVGKMQRMQSLGPPPNDLISDMDLAEHATDVEDPACPQQ